MATTTHRPATGAQVAFVNRLLGEREVPASWTARIAELLDAEPEMRKVSEVIDSLRELPYARTDRAEASTATPTVAAGLYCLGSKADPRRYKVDIPTEGRWAGRTFVRLVLPNSETENIRNRQQAADILAGIAADPDAAHRLYADVTGRCWKCNRMLTDAVSVARGTGPDCAKVIAGG
jgi:hypothetical protein